MVYLLDDDDCEDEEPEEERVEKKAKRRPVHCFFPADLVARLEDIVAAARKKQRHRRAPHRATQRALRHRLAAILHGLNERAQLPFLLHRSAADPFLQDPLRPFLPGLWQRGQLPVRSNDHRVLLRLFTWLQGMALKMKSLTKEEKQRLRQDVAATVTKEEEMAAVESLLHDCRAQSIKRHRIAAHILDDDRLFQEFVKRRTWVLRQQGMLNTIECMKESVAGQLKHVLGKSHPYLKIICR